MTRAFDLEQDILKCWNVVDDIRDIANDMDDGHMDAPEVVQALRAYHKIYQRRFEKCFRLFEEYNQEAWAWRHRAQELEESKPTPKNGAKMGKSKQQKEVDH